MRPTKRSTAELEIDPNALALLGDQVQAGHRRKKAILSVSEKAFQNGEIDADERRGQT